VVRLDNHTGDRRGVCIWRYNNTLDKLDSRSGGSDKIVQGLVLGDLGIWERIGLIVGCVYSREPSHSLAIQTEARTIIKYKTDLGTEG
jgi:hypothetical protein